MPYIPLTPEDERHQWEGMQPRERIVWREWLKSNADRFDRYEYNVRVGGGDDPGSGYTEKEREYWQNVTKKRLDVLAWSGGLPTIIEVEENPGTGNAGQILSYEILWKAGHPTGPVAALLVVCDNITADMQLIMFKAGVRVEQVHPSYAELKGRRL